TLFRSSSSRSRQVMVSARHGPPSSLSIAIRLAISSRVSKPCPDRVSRRDARRLYACRLGSVLGSLGIAGGSFRSGPGAPGVRAPAGAALCRATPSDLHPTVDAATVKALPWCLSLVGNTMNGSNLGERMVAVSFGDVMRRLTAERGVSLRALARQVPCNAGYLSKVSRDLKRPSEDVAARLDDILGAGGALLAAHAPAPVPDSDPDAARLLYVERHPMRIDAVVVDGLAATLASQRRLEDVVGSA